MNQPTGSDGMDVEVVGSGSGSGSVVGGYYKEVGRC